MFIVPLFQGQKQPNSKYKIVVPQKNEKLFLFDELIPNMLLFNDGGQFFIHSLTWVDLHLDINNIIKS